MLCTFRKLFLATMLFAWSFSLTAQSDQQKLSREQLAKAQATLIAEKMELKKATGKKFISTYCDFKREIWALGPLKCADKDCKLTPEQAKKEEKEHFAYHQKVLDVREKYQQKFLTFLTKKQFKHVRKLEKEMMNHLADIDW